MLLFSSLKFNFKRRFSITPSVVLLLIMIQLAAWYPFLNSAYHEIIYQHKLKNRAVQNWQVTLSQAKRLESASFITNDWLTHRVIAFKDGVPTQWEIEGTATLEAWRTLFEHIEEQVALRPFAILWQSRLDGTWHARLSFDVLASISNTVIPNKATYDWLPIQSQTGHFVASEWQLLSILYAEGKASALVKYKQMTFWVSEGSWLSKAALTVDRILVDRVILSATNGEQVVLSIRRKGETNDSFH